ncbi:MAG: hypothetical protein HRU31_11570 [Rhodobacteraceae bacterium]|nr:hypothetical protein [Paracoccaceae bacterium]
MSPEFLGLVAAYILCSEAAALRQLTADETRQCLGLYQEIKLELVPGLTPEDFAALTPKDRAWVNREGYRAYREWRMANADMVAQSEQEARQLLALR